MSWGLVGGALIGAGGSIIAGDKAASGAQSAANTTAAAQMAGLDYLKEQERLPMYYRDQALGLLAGEYGLNPYQSSLEAQPVAQAAQAALPTAQPGTASRSFNRRPTQIPAQAPTQASIEGEYIPAAPEGGIAGLAQRSPLYSAIMSSRDAGEEAILRGQSATGGLRGGAAIGDLVDYNTELENQALLTSYQNIMGGLSSMSGAQGYAPQIAQQYSNIGETRGAGQMAGVQARQDAYGGVAQGLGDAASAWFNRPRSSV